MTAVSQFWARARRDLAELPGGQGLNIAYEAVDRHVLDGNGRRIAIRWIGSGGSKRDISYAELSQAASRFANALKDLGIGAGDRVFSLLGRVPELHITVLEFRSRKRRPGIDAFTLETIGYCFLAWSFSTNRNLKP